MERWEALTPEERKKFPPLIPDFVIELSSESDSLKLLQEEMQEYLKNGLRLGFLINPQDGKVEIYRQGQSVLISCTPATEVTATQAKPARQGFQTLDFSSVRAGGLRLYSREFHSLGLGARCECGGSSTTSNTFWRRCVI